MVRLPGMCPSRGSDARPVPVTLASGREAGKGRSARLPAVREAEGLGVRKRAIAHAQYR